MNSVRALFAAVLAASVGVACAQAPNFPQVMPANTVYGSLYTSGLGIAIPFSTLYQQLFNTQEPSVVRIKLNGPLILHADFLNGNDSNSCLGPLGAACKTVQGAYNKLVTNYDTAGQPVTISFNNNDSSCLFITTGWTGGGPVIISGPGGSPPTIGFNCPTLQAVNIAAPLPAPLLFQNMKLTGLYGLYINAPGSVYLSNLNFGAAGQTHISVQVGGAAVYCQGNYTISGGAVAHYQTTFGGSISCSGITVALSGTPAFTVFAAAQNVGSLSVPGTTFSGSATGIRYISNLNAVIQTGSGNSPNFFPGNSAGFSQLGGQYQ